MRPALRALPGAVRLVPAGARRAHSATLALPPRLRRRLGALLLALVALAGAYMGWFRDSSLVAVEEVTVEGLTTRDAQRVRAALTSVARDMTTLHVRRDELEQAASAFPVVRALEITPDFPHGLEIRVIEHRAVAVIVAPGERVPVAADGTLLRGLPTDGRLPSLPAGSKPAGDRLAPGELRDTLAVAGAAPDALRGRVGRVRRRGGRGFVAAIRGGPVIVFGGLDRLGEKWAAATRVLADPSAAGASYIDVRLPERPVAGGLPVETIQPVAPAGTPVPEDGAPQPAPEPPADAPPADPAQAPAPAPAPEAVAPPGGAPPAAVPRAQAPPAGPDGGAQAPAQP